VDSMCKVGICVLAIGWLVGLCGSVLFRKSLERSVELHGLSDGLSQETT
jgi:hypothetical protein